MTDFISRLAARAVAQTPDVRPAPSAIVDARPEPATPAPQRTIERPIARATPAAPEVRSEAPEPRVERVEPSAPVTEEHVATPALRERIVERTRVRDKATREPIEAARARVRAPAPAEIVRAAPVAAAARAPMRVVEQSATRATASAAAAEPPVRVHIGRLEVRANLEQPPAPPQASAKTAASEGLSLSEYLRGRRSA